MIAQKRYAISLKGTSPLILNVPNRELELERKKKKKDELDQFEEQTWYRKAEFGEKGEVIIPARWLKAGLETACQRSRMIPSFATSKKETFTFYVSSFMITDKPTGYLEKDLIPYGTYVGAQGGQGNKKSKRWAIRPMLKKWKAEFEIIDPAGRMQEKELLGILEYLGLYIGIGDNRKYNFGRFDVKIGD